MILTHLFGLDAGLERASLDLRFRTVGTMARTVDVVNIEIDDNSLSDLGRWPWPRETLAGIIDVLNECGAKAIVLDIILPHPQETRFTAPFAQVYDDDTGELVGTGPPVAIHDDAILARALLRHRSRVWMPLHVQSPPAATSPVEQAMAQVMRDDDSMSLRDALDAIPASIRATTNADQMRRAYLRVRGLRAVASMSIVKDWSGPALHGGMIGPLVIFAEASGNTGFVTFDADPDGVVRRIPLVASTPQGTFLQLATSVAVRELFPDTPPSISSTASGIVITDGRNRRQIPTDDAGCMLINWMPMPDGRPIWPAIRASAVAKAAMLKKSADAHKTLWRQRCLSLIKLSGGNFRTDTLQEAVFEAAMLQHNLDQLYLRQVELEAQRQRAVLFDPLDVPPAPTQELLDQQRMQDRLDECFLVVLSELTDDGRIAAFVAQGDNAPAADKIRQAKEILELLDSIPAANDRLATKRQELIASLSKQVAGRICVVGSTSTGAGDFVPTAMNKRTAGMNVHVNILNTIVSGRFIREASIAINAGIITLLGLGVTFIASRKSALASSAILVAIVALYIFISFVLFRWFDIWLAMVAPPAGAVLAFVMVVAYRQLTEERQKRHIRQMFARSLSPALVDRLLEDPSLMRLGGERRHLSCFFSDIEGFTRLSEGLGEQRTVNVLNRYFDLMTGIIQSPTGGYLNKFLGDGLLVLFGAPVHQNDHAARAIRCAIACGTKIEQLNTQLTDELGSEVRLRCRIGITTGQAMVGNCGSSDRMDYTAIGDTVNLAARLESANKHLGTSILVDSETWNDSACDDLVIRNMGPIVVVGRARPVVTINILGPADMLDDTTIEQARMFSRARELFSQGDFRAGAELFEQLAKLTPEDLAVKLFLRHCMAMVKSGPPPGWDGAIVLEGK